MQESNNLEKAYELLLLKQDQQGQQARNVSACVSRSDIGLTSSLGTIVLSRTLRNGSFGTVYSCIYNGDRSSYCAKKVKYDHDHYNREIAILRSVRDNPNENVIEMIDYSVSEENGENYYTIIMPKFQLSLKDLMQTGSLYDTESIARDILQGLHHLHRMNIMHRDIKPDNILVSTNKTAVICDLGSAKQFGSGIVHTSYVCTRWYRAPELILLATKYDGAVDIWACGCVIIELICKKVAFKAVDSIGQLCCIFKSLGIPTENEIYEFNDELDPLIINRVQKQHAHVGLRKCVQRLLFPRTTHTNSNLVELICGCLQYSPSKRNRFVRSAISSKHKAENDNIKR